MSEVSDYVNLVNDIIAKQIEILGPDIVMVKARNVSGLKFTTGNKVESIDSDPQIVLQSLIDEFVGLSGQIVKNILSPVFAKYPDIKVTIQ